MGSTELSRRKRCRWFRCLGRQGFPHWQCTQNEALLGRVEASKIRADVDADRLTALPCSVYGRCLLRFSSRSSPVPSLALFVGQLTNVTAINVVPFLTDVCMCGKVLTNSRHSKDCQIHSTFLICLKSFFFVYVLHAHIPSPSPFVRAQASSVALFFCSCDSSTTTLCLSVLYGIGAACNSTLPGLTCGKKFDQCCLAKLAHDAGQRSLTCVFSV